MKIGFFTPQIDVRGTTVATFDYAIFNQTILGNESIVIYNEIDPRNDDEAITNFKNSLSVEAIKIPEISNEYYKANGQKIRHALDSILASTRCDAAYILKGGKNDGLYSDVVPTFVHCTGYQNEPHGSVYAYVSGHVSNTASGGAFPVVPHMINLPDINEDFRAEWGIPNDCTVFGRSGGIDTWNLPFASEVVEAVVSNREDVCFVFQNTPKFIDHPRVGFLPSNSDMRFKTKFINTCDALLHARREGESFGLTCGEFSVRNKPVITWFGSNERNHIDVLGDRGIYYRGAQDLFDILSSFGKQDPKRDFNCYRDFLPEPVMEKFDKVFCEFIRRSK